MRNIKGSHQTLLHHHMNHTWKVPNGISGSGGAAQADSPKPVQNLNDGMALVYSQAHPYHGRQAGIFGTVLIKLF
jgi:hypothetical protein